MEPRPTRVRFFYVAWTPRLTDGQYVQQRGLHLWVGALGLHVFWPLWESRFDWYPKSQRGHS